MENAYVLSTLLNNEFDQIYHEHMFYYTLQSITKLIEMHGMRVIDVAMAPIHGGSAVVVATKAGHDVPVRDSVADYMKGETTVFDNDLISRFVEGANDIKYQLRRLVGELIGEGKKVWSYGASAKGTTLLNYIGLDNRHIEYCADSTSIKLGKFVPMANIEIRSEEEALEARPDYFLLTAWNYADQIVEKVRQTGNSETKFIVPFPSVTIV